MNVRNGWKADIPSVSVPHVRFAPLLFVIAVTGCGMPSESFPVADFDVACPSMQTGEVSKTVEDFAREHKFAIDLQESSADYIRLTMDGNRPGNDIYVEYWSNDNVKPSGNCSVSARPCIDIVAFTLGSFPADEMTEDARRQRIAARVLRQRLENVCEA